MNTLEWFKKAQQDNGVRHLADEFTCQEPAQRVLQTSVASSCNED